MTRAPRLAAAAALVVATVVLSSCGEARSGPTKGSAAHLATSPVVRQNLMESVKAPGELGYGTPHDLDAAGTGTLTELPAVGRVIRNGDVLYRLDDRPIVHFDGQTPAWRALGPGTGDGDDVRQLEQALTDLGYADGLDVDGKWTDGTTAAVKRWQKALGLDQTGAIPFGQVSFEPGPVRVASRPVRLGTQAQPGGPVLAVSGTRRVATASLDADQKELAPIGGKVALTFEDGTKLSGKVIAAKSVKDPQSGNDKLEVTVALLRTAKLPEQADGSDVSIEFTHVIATKALTVPVTALVALSGGGYAVQKVTRGGATSYVPVTPRAFANDVVEISGGDVAAGDKVVDAP